MRLKYVTNYSNEQPVTKSSTVPDCLVSESISGRPYNAIQCNAIQDVSNTVQRNIQ